MKALVALFLLDFQLICSLHHIGEIESLIAKLLFRGPDFQNLRRRLGLLFLNLDGRDLFVFLLGLCGLRFMIKCWFRIDTENLFKSRGLHGTSV